jgi:hypothetical protein
MRHIYLILRYVWASPASAVGLVVSAVALGCGANVCLVNGVIEVAGGRTYRCISLLPRSLRFAAITFGHVIIGIDHEILRRVRPHEHIHVQQYERWGILFFPLYLLSSFLQFVRGRDPYLNNYFEREAYAAEAMSNHEA